MCDRSFDIWPKSIGTNHLGERDLSHEIKFANFQVYLFQNGDGFAFYTISVSCKQNQPLRQKHFGEEDFFTGLDIDLVITLLISVEFSSEPKYLEKKFLEGC